MQRRNHRDSTIKTRHRQSVVHLYSLLIAKDHFYSCIFSMVSSLYLPFSFPSARDLALRSRIFLRSLSSFSLVMTTCKGKKKKWVGTNQVFLRIVTSGQLEMHNVETIKILMSINAGFRQQEELQRPFMFDGNLALSKFM